ncbi:hypothetical protein BDN72DRAFT_262873 [Pluteus cervinus]|uniref:Uncharacterized protein n=1 Tax=Pluteus cervinus TaxID=181527 RepID=A0ACD3AI42_9AGAR|nr:hypothetical protein BDN72DRAFT_262873 [Pluteus cervinus]
MTTKVKARIKNLFSKGAELQLPKDGCLPNSKPATIGTGLPHDLLHEIFLDISISSPNCFVLYDSLQLLMLVCSHWKGIIMTSPLLWTRITVRSITMPVENECRVLSRFLKLSSGLPLAIIYYRAPDKTLDALMTESHRWKSFLTNTLPDSRLKSIQHNFPLLEELSGLVSSQSPIEAFKDSPRLGRVCLSFWGDPQKIRIILPWDQIQSFETPKRGPGRDILQRCSHLYRYALSSTSRTWAPGLSVMSPRIRHTSLRDISLAWADELNSLELPALESLEIWDQPDINLFSILNGFSSRSQCSLKSFTVRELRKVEPTEIVQFFELNPRIFDLSFSLLDVDSENMASLFNILSLHKSSLTLIPLLLKLGHLCVGIRRKDMEVEYFDHGPLLDMIYSRLIPRSDAAPLTRLKIRTCSETRTSSIPQIQALWKVERLTFDLEVWGFS